MFQTTNQCSKWRFPCGKLSKWWDFSSLTPDQHGVFASQKTRIIHSERSLPLLFPIQTRNDLVGQSPPQQLIKMYQPSAYRALMISPYYLMVQSVKSRNDIPMKSPADFWCSAARVKAVTKEQRNPPEHPARLRSPLSKTWGFKLFLGDLKSSCSGRFPK